LGYDALMSDVVIETASAADAPAIDAIARECELTVDVQAELVRSYARLLVARGPSGVVGFLLAWRAADELHLTDLGVTANARRQGHAQALVAALGSEGLRQGSRVVLLEVREGNSAARSLYRRLGFAELDRRRRYYADTGEDAVVMALELR
jgi:[ribosomal protein S18]-alanine N-acetyltransferase